MNQNTINAYQRNAILTASPAELTLMLYDGAIKFCNIAIMAIEKGYGKGACESEKGTGDYFRTPRDTRS